MVLRIKRGSPPYMLYCLLLAAWLCMGQVLGSTMLILPCLAAFLLLTAVAAYKGFATPILLFFLPWSTLLKMAPGTLSFYTFALGIVCIVYLIRKKFRVNIFCVLCTIPVFAVTMLAKLLESYGISNSYILFVFLLAFFPVVAGEIRENVNFKTLTLFFSVGIILAALSARQLLIFPKIARFITTDTLRTVTRLSGYYGDPNFYSTHISAVLAGVLLLILQETNSRYRTGWIVLGVALLYCGFLSVSKSFILTIAAVSALWLYKFLRMRIAMKKKLLALLTIFLVVVIILFSGIFDTQLEMIVTRFQNAEDVSGLTTGRTDAWKQYIDAFLNDSQLLLLGSGYVNQVLTEKGSHNTLLQCLYQFGVIGTVFVGFWLYYYIRGMTIRRNTRCAVLDRLILITGVFLPWMAIDLMFFDEFFLMPMFAVSGVLYFGKQDGNGKDRNPAASGLTRRERNGTI